MTYISKKTTVETLFQFFGIDWKKLPQNSSIDVSSYEKTAQVKGFDLEKNVESFGKVTHLYRKEDSEAYIVQTTLSSFKCSKFHKVFTDKYEWESIENLSDQFSIMSTQGIFIPAFKYKTSEIIPILDFHVEGLDNYFSNGVLSHNSTPGGHAVKFYASWRARVSKMEDIAVSKVVIGNSIKIRNVKNKVGVPKRSAALELKYETGFDPDTEYIQFIIDFGLVNVAVAWISNEEWGMKVQGREKLLEWLRANPDTFDKCKKLVNDSFARATILDQDNEEADPEDEE